LVNRLAAASSAEPSASADQPKWANKADLVAEALAAKITTLPVALTRTLTWDEGNEMAEHATFTQETGIEVYACDPKSPSQRGSAAATRTPTACSADNFPAPSTSGP
jgi:hypothetical protein